MKIAQKDEAYCFQGGALVVPGDTAAMQALEGLPRKIIAETFPGAEYTAIPQPDGGELIPTYVLKPGDPLPSGWSVLSIRQALPNVDQGVIDGSGPAGRLFRAYHILQWREESRFCGSCGSPNGDSPDELARLCPACGRLEFPRISPAIIVLIINDREEALLAHNKKFSGGVYSLIAGFNEAGENLESTVVREIREEVGLEVREIRYVVSQPWPFPNSLMLGFTARYVSGAIRPDGEEIEDARWFARDALPALPGNGSVSRYLIGLWLDGRL